MINFVGFNNFDQFKKKTSAAEELSAFVCLK